MSTYTIENLRQMNKEEISNLKKDELVNITISLISALNVAKMCKNNNTRHSEAIDILKTGPHAVFDLATKMNITSKNASTILAGLKKKGYIIHTDDIGRKYIHEEPQAEQEAQ